MSPEVQASGAAPAPSVRPGTPGDRKAWFARAGLPALARLALAGVFVFAAVPKLLDPGTFAVSIENYRVLPPDLVGKAAVMLPVAELVLALALLVGPCRRGAALLCTLLLLVFALAMGQARMRGIDLSCGCFGAALEAKVSWWTVVRTSMMALVGAYVFWRAGAQTVAVAPRAGDPASS